MAEVTARQVLKWVSFGLLGLVILGFAISSVAGTTGLGGTRYGYDGTASSPVGDYAMPGVATEAGASDGEAIAPSPIPEGGASGEDNGEKIVRTGDMTLRSTDVMADVEKLHDLADKHGAFVENESFSSGDAPEGYAVFRVPADKYEAFLTDAKKVGEMQSLQVANSDMTKRYRDAATELASGKRELAAVEDLLKRAKSVQDILAIREQTKAIRQQNDMLEAELKGIDDRASYSTLTVYIKSPAAVKGEDDWYRNTVQGILSTVQNSVRTAVLLLAALLPWGVLAFVAWGIFRLARRSRKSAPVSSPDKE